MAGCFIPTISHIWIAFTGVASELQTRARHLRNRHAQFRENLIVIRFKQAFQVALVVVAALTLLIHTPAAAQTAVGAAAARLQPGTFGDVTTTNINPTLSATGASGMIFGYTDKGVWDPISRAFFFIGGD